MNNLSRTSNPEDLQDANYHQPSCSNISNDHGRGEPRSNLSQILSKQFSSLQIELEIEHNTQNESVIPKEYSEASIYTEDKGPRFYNVKDSYVSRPIVPKRIPEVFSPLVLPGELKPGENLEEFQKQRIKSFIGNDLSNEEFEQLSTICSPLLLKTDKEPEMPTKYPTPTICPFNKSKVTKYYGDNLNVVKKFKLRQKHDENNIFTKKLKYRGMKMIEPPEEELHHTAPGTYFEPGKDLLFHIRVYRPFKFHHRERQGRGRHSVLSYDLMMVGRQTLTQLRDSIVCANDVSVKMDVSENRETLTKLLPTSRDMFPSGLLFINNVFYVDDRKGCKDYSVVIRDWCLRKGMGDFPTKPMSTVKLEDLVIKLGHPDVFLHQGDCEHIFIFSEIRLLNPTDPLWLSTYPYHTLVSQNQVLYCTACAEYAAKWIVIGSTRVPFDPAFFCETCLKLYMYIGDKKVGEFKLYPFMGNQLKMLRKLN